VNSSIHNGYSWGLNIIGSANVNISNNVFFNFRPIGLGVQKSRNITIDNNVVAGIIDRTTFEGGDQMVDKAGGISICAYQEEDECADMFVRNNLVAGSVYGGFVMHGHDCGDTSGRYSGNVAHSIHGIKSGAGLYVKNSLSQTECTEYSNFKAYKCYYQGAFAYPTSNTMIF
jgi:polygalacturonase